MKKNKKSNIILISLICLMILYVINASLITKHILQYTKLFIEKLFPASFLFFTFSTLLIEYNIIEKISNTLKINGANFYVIAMSLISGFPSGSKYTKELLDKNLITEKNANYLIKFTHFPNPLFILGPVSLLFPSKEYTWKILSCIILANFIPLVKSYCGKIFIDFANNHQSAVLIPKSALPSPHSAGLGRALPVSYATIRRR